MRKVAGGCCGGVHRTGAMAVCIVLSISLISSADTGKRNLRALSLDELFQVEVISSTKTTKETKNAPSIITTITSSQIEESGARTLSDLLKMVAGIQILNRRNGRDMVWIRGIKDGYNANSLLLIDGIPVRDISFRSWSPDEIIPLNNIERIEIIRGPGSALYGGNASAGIISVFTKEHSHPSHHTRAALSYGSFDTQEVEFDSGFSAGETGFTVAGNYYDTDGHRMSRDRKGNPTTHRDSVSARNISAKIRHNNFNFGLFRNELLTAYPLYASDVEKPQRFVNLSAFMNRIVQKKQYFIKPQLYYFRSDVEYEKTNKDDDGLPLSILRSRFGSESIGFENQITCGISRNNTLTMGISGEYHKINDFQEENVLPVHEVVLWLDDGGDRTPHSYNYAAYLQDEFDLLEGKLGVVGGLRYDFYEGFRGEVTPRLGVVGNLVEDLTFKALWGKAFSPPTFMEMFLVQPSRNRGNPTLEPERIDTFETEVSYLLGRNAQARLVYFHNNMSDFIELGPGSIYQNVLETRKTSGIELDMRLEFLPGLKYIETLSIMTNYTFIDAKDDLGEDISSLAEHSANLAITFRNKYITLYNGFNYLGERNESDTYHSSVTDEEYRERNNKGEYLIWDLNLAVRNFSKWPIGLELTIQNLLDTEHYNPTYSDSYYDYTKRGRSIRLSMSLER